MKITKADAVRESKLTEAMTSSIYSTVALAMLTGTGADFTYPEHPPYCAKSGTMKSIPPLSVNALELTGGALSLLHVTSIIRHGARTPTDAHKCWKGYNEDWDCDLTTLTTAPDVKDVKDISTNGDLTQFDGQGKQFIFEKRYDLQESETSEALGNILGGTCQRGQLLKTGYGQQHRNGNILKNAYVRDATKTLNTDVDINHMLFDFDENAKLSNENRAYEGSSLYFRSDDFQRTLMSGQVLLQSLFESLIERHNNDTEKFSPVVRVHTNDRDTDILFPNHNACRKLNELKFDALTSVDYRKEFVESEQSVKLSKMLDNNLDASQVLEEPDTAIDCLMTTICNDRKLPDILNDYVPSSYEGDSEYGKNRFKRVADNAIRKKAFVYNYRDAAYAKLAMTPLWYEILSNILPHTNLDPDELRTNWPNVRYPAPKFALFSGHDTTIMALLSSLDLDMDLNIWPPYASMLLIELYTISTTHLSPPEIIRVNDKFPTKIVFRMIYNGEVITHLMPKCDEELCDMNNLIRYLPEKSDMLRWKDDCKATAEATPSPLPSPNSAINAPAHAGGMSTLSVVGLCVLCTMVGVTITYVKMESYWREHNARNREVVSMELGPEEADACGSARVYGVVPASNAIL